MAKILMQDEIERFQEIKDEIRELLHEASRIVRDTSEEDRAKGYWQAHIMTALDDRHEYLGRSMCTMQQSIDALAEQFVDGDRAEQVE